MHFPLIKFCFFISLSVFSLTLTGKENRIPFYEDYLKSSDLSGFLEVAKKFLVENPDSIEAPRVSHDYLIVAKANRDIEGINFATSLLLFKYGNSIPALHFITSFEKDSKTLTKLLIGKANFGNLESKEFAISYCRALILIARTRGPEFLANSSLRLRAFLLAQKAGVDEIETSAAKALQIEAEKNNGFSKVAKIVTSDKNLTDKLSALSQYSGMDAEFTTAYYLAQLSKKERTSDAIITIQLKQALFGTPPSIEKALQSIASLPTKIGKQADVQTFLGMAHHLDGKSELAIKTLSKIPSSSSNQIMAQWGETAQSFANGIQFSENRKKLLLEALGKAFDQLSTDQDSLFATLNWNSESNKDSINYTAHIGISKEQERLEINVMRGNKTIFAYRTDEKNSSLFSSDLNQSIHFNSQGVFPVPQFDIKRDVETGGFSYNFNLNFSATQDKLLAEGTRLIENPYLSTSKGRNVFLTYLLSEKPMWMSPAKSVTGGTSFPLFLLDAESPTPTSITITTDLSNNLKEIQIGRFSLSNISLGDTDSFDNIPAWPEATPMDKEKFDFSLFMKVLQEFSKASQ